MSINYAGWYAEAKLELQQVQASKSQLERQLAEYETKIAALTQTLNALAPLVGELPLTDPSASGITDRIRNIFQQCDEPLAPTQIRDQLEAAGCDLKSYSNPLATIHTVLKRLVDNVEIKAMPINIAGGKKYKCFVGIVKPQQPDVRPRP